MSSDDAKAVKKEETDDKSLSSILVSRHKKPINANANANAKAKVKKEEPKDDDDDFEKPIRKVTGSKVKKVENAVYSDDDDVKPISKRNSTAATTKADNEKLKKKKSKGDEKKSEAEQNGKKKDRKVYDLPGQKRDPPEERDPLRIFYETLYEQVPCSEMAQIWMMESGLLSFGEAKKVYEKKQVKNKLSSPTSAISAVNKTMESVTVKKKTPCSPVSSNGKKKTDSTVAVKKSRKRKVNNGSSEDDSDDNFSIKKVAKKQKAK